MAPNIQTTLLNRNHLNNTSTTNSLILDSLFYQSIQSRLQKAFTFDDHTDGTDKNVIESVIEGILSSTKKSKKKVDAKFEQRLNLCQLTNLAIGRTHHVTFSAPVASRRIREIDTTTNCAFADPIHPTFCRRHRLPNCSQSRCLNAKVGGPGLAMAIPAFLKTSANMLRSVLDSNDDVKPLTVAGQQVMGGGMPPRWYDLFLDLLTQAAIQNYMCDGKTGLETIYEIFSYGYVEDEDEEDTLIENEEDDYDEDDEEDDDEDDDNYIWNVKASDHHLLFPKTRTMFLFKLQFTQIKDGYTLEAHFKELEKLYPLVYFERNMCDFIQMLIEAMDIPALDKCDIPDVASPIKSPEDLPEPQFTSNTIPSLYKYPGDGSLLMPEIPDIHEDDIPAETKKRSAYTAELIDHHHDNYKHHC
ncbi:hypothetical protein BD408DRAFT_351916 [Parasitella parasitica]|nr:hypothetical protein BD408DRAFT_351916 [Parasitella parasitica]